MKVNRYFNRVLDAKKAIEIDPTYIKAYYRRASGYFVLQKYDEALKDYNYVLTIIPNDQDLKDKIEKCKNANKKKLWFDSISSEGRSPETYNSFHLIFTIDQNKI